MSLLLLLGQQAATGNVTVALTGVSSASALGNLGTTGGIPQAGLLIEGVSREIRNNWEIHAQANGRAVMRCQVVSLDGSYRPALDEAVTFMVDGTQLFGGAIEAVSEAGVGNIGSVPIVSTIVARDYNALATRRFMSEDISSGTLKAALTTLVAYIPGGVTLDPAQVNGPTIAEYNCVDLRVDEALNNLTTMTGYVWEITSGKKLRMYSPGTYAAPFNITTPSSLAIGDVTVEPTRAEYANRVVVKNDKVRKQADDAAEQAAHGLWELLATAPDNTSDSAAQDMANGILARVTPVIKRVKYRTRELGIAPGQTQTVNLAARNINNTYLITDVVMRPLGTSWGVVSEVTAVEGLVYQTGWRETYKRWSGSALPMAGAVYGSAAKRFPYALGASGLEAVRSAGPDWVPASGGPTPGTGSMQVQINTVPRGTTAGTVVVRLRAFSAGVSVKARLYDVTDSVACAGESAPVTSTSWQTVTFSTTLTSGSHFYELQLLPGAANEDVFAAGGYVE